MIARTLLCLTLAPLGALAQLQVYAANASSCASSLTSAQTLTAVGSSYSVGSAALGDTIHTQFRVKDTGSQPVALSVSLAGEGFTIAAGAAPYVPAGEESAFCVDFAPTLIGSYSAILQVNNIDITLMGTVAPSATLTLPGTATPLTAGAPVNFGNVLIGQTQTQGFLLSNSYASSLTVHSVTVSGAGFSGPSGASFPLQIEPGQPVTFQVTFTPVTDTVYSGSLAVDGRVFVLQGQGLDPASQSSNPSQPSQGSGSSLPDVSLVLASTVGASAQQNSLSISLNAASPASETGTLVLTFQSSVASVSDDPSIEFLTGAARQAAVTIAPGSTAALIDGQTSIAFQTGTTAGTITFTLAMENGATEESSLLIPPSTVVFDSASAVRELNSIEVSVAGFDNTYSASQLTFTFFDVNGNPMPQGPIDVNAAGDFQSYFSSGQAGGSFSLLANFPVSGSTYQLGFVTVQIANSFGSSTAQQIPIGN